MPTTALQYQTAYFGFVEALKTLIETNSPDADVETRYIVSEGSNGEQWLAYLRDDEGVVDKWMITVMQFAGQNQEQGANIAPIGGEYKPFRLTVDYFADYRHGLDVVGTIGAETTTNTEHEFLKKVMAVDLALEKSRRCLHNEFEILNWTFNLRLRRFDTASVHWANGIVDVRYTGIRIN